MKVSVVLADKGTVNSQNGTLNLLNAGWTVNNAVVAMTPAGPLTVASSQAVAIFFEVEPKHCNHPIELLLELVSQDGHAVKIQGPAGPQDMRISQQLTVVSPAGMPVGSPGVGNALFEFSPLPMDPGGYEWRVSLATEHLEHWSARFQLVAAQPPGPPIFGLPAN